jgi:phosphoribosyl 1,2-cyclic phosphate phosphodiesterase
MKMKILGSGGAIPTPKIGCSCSICTNARDIGHPYKRNSSSLFLEDVNALFDCPEDIHSSVNENNILKIDSLFITHWHPDHCFGLRLIMQHGFDFYREIALKNFSLYIPESVYNVLIKVYPAITYQLNTLKTAKLNLLKDRDIISLEKFTIQPIGFNGPDSDTFGYLISENDKKVLYSPCDTILFKKYSEFKALDLWLTECGCFSDFKHEISFENTIDRIKEIKPKKTIFTHIEEEELKMAGWNHLKTIKEKYNEISFDFAYDKMEIEI